MAEAAEAGEIKHLQCTEVWGGFMAVDRTLQMPGLDGRVYSRPYRGQAGGDVHYVSSCGAGVYSRLLLADVSGHGTKVAQTAARLQRLMRRYVASHSQAGLVRAVNREFAAVTDAGTFATAVVMTYDSARRRLLVSNAGHPPPLIYRATAGEWSYLRRHGNRDASRDAPPGSPGASGAVDLPLGIEPEADYHEFERRLEAGDIVVCYTDWLTEARDATGRMLGLEGLLDLARALPILPPGEMVRALLSAVTRWSNAPAQGGVAGNDGSPGGDYEQDDVTLLLFQATGRREHTSVGSHLLAPFRVLRAVAGSYLPT